MTEPSQQPASQVRPAGAPEVEQVLRDDAAVRAPDPDPVREALHRAILLEDVFDVTLSDQEIHPLSLGTSEAASRVGRPAPGRSLMCGICGIVSPTTPPELAVLRAMTGRLRHRGPGR